MRTRQIKKKHTHTQRQARKANHHNLNGKTKGKKEINRRNTRNIEHIENADEARLFFLAQKPYCALKTQRISF